MNKRGLLGLIVIILVLLVVGFFWFVKWYGSVIPEVLECSEDIDCVPEACCHASSCTAISNAPKCEGPFCSASCEPDTMDCGQGSCSCIEGKCTAVFNEQ